MNSIFRYTFSVFLSLLFAANANAQGFSVLPYTDKSPTECISIVQNYEITGVIKNDDVAKYQESLEKVGEAYDKQQEANTAYTEAKAEQDQLNQQYKDAGCKGDAYSKKECVDMLKKNVDTKANLDKAKADKDAADKDFAQKQKDANAAQEKAGLGNGMIPLDVGTINDVLGCAIKTGRISLQMVPYFITYVSNFLLSLVGLISMLFIVIGGYMYITEGVSGDKGKAKEYIKNALIGMGVAIMSWVIVNMIITVITS